MQKQFIAAVLELADSREVDSTYAVQAIEKIFVAAAPTLFVGALKETLSTNLTQIFLERESNCITVAQANETLAGMLQIVIEKRCAPWEPAPSARPGQPR